MTLIVAVAPEPTDEPTEDPEPTGSPTPEPSVTETDPPGNG